MKNYSKIKKLAPQNKNYCVQIPTVKPHHSIFKIEKPIKLFTITKINKKLSLRSKKYTNNICSFSRIAYTYKILAT